MRKPRRSFSPRRYWSKPALTILATAILAAVLLTGCTTVAPGSERLQFLRFRPTAEFLAAEDRVDGTCEFIKSKNLGQEGGPGTRQEVRNYAVSIGADAVLWYEYSEMGTAGTPGVLLRRGNVGIVVGGESGTAGQSIALFYVCDKAKAK